MQLYISYFLIGFQDPATPIMEGIVDLHNYIFFFLIIVLAFVLVMLVHIIYYFYFKVYFPDNNYYFSHRFSVFRGNQTTHGTVLEIVWTLIPSFILMAVAVPSFALLYSMDEITTPKIYVRIIGHQWYWSYEYASFRSSFIQFFTPLDNAIGEVLAKLPEKFFELSSFDSYMLAENDLKKGQFRLLETDKELHLPSLKHLRFLVTALDVLHSWTVPSTGIKVDAVPGRLSQVNAYLKRDGIYYGQCSEICGVNHGFMPITIRVIPYNNFVEYSAFSLKK